MSSEQNKFSRALSSIENSVLYKQMLEYAVEIFAEERVENIAVKTLSAVIELVNADQGSFILLLDDQNYVIASHQHQKKSVVKQPPRNIRLPNQAIKAIKENRIIVESGGGNVQTPTGRIVIHALYMPLVLQNVTGLIMLHKHKIDDEFTMGNVDILDAFTGIARGSLFATYATESFRRARGSIDRLQLAQHRIASIYVAKNVSHIMLQVLDTLLHIFDFDYCAISLVDKESRIISTDFADTKVPDLISIGWKEHSHYSLDEKDILTKVYKLKKSIMVSGWRDDLNEKIFHDYYHSNLSRIYSPILTIDEECLGVVECGFHKSKAYKLNDIVVQELEIFLPQVAIAMHNQQRLKTFKTLAIQEQRVKTLNRLMQVLSDVLNPKESLSNTLKNLSNEIRDMLKADFVVILPIDDVGNIVTNNIVTAPENLQNDFRKMISKPRTGGGTSTAFTNGIHIVTDTSQLDLTPRFVEKYGVKSFVAVRIGVENKRLGVLFIDYKSQINIKDIDEQLLQRIAEIIAGAIQNHELMTHEIHLRNKLNSIIRLVNIISTEISREPETAINSIPWSVLNYVSDILPNELSAVWSFEKNSHSLQLVAVKGDYSNEVSDFEVQMGVGIIGYVAENLETYFSNNVSDDHISVHLPNTPLGEQQAIIASPLMFDDKLLGVWMLSRFQVGRFDFAEDLELVKTITEVFSILFYISQHMAEIKQQLKILDQDFVSTFEDRGERYAGMLFYNTIAHDIGNLLNNISAELKILNDDKRFMQKLSRRSRTSFINVYERTDASIKTIDEFLELTRTASSKKGVYEVNNIVNRAIRLMETRISKNKIILEKNLVENKILIKVNLFRIVEVMLNLLSNAIKSIRAKNNNKSGKILVVSRIVSSQYVEVSVTDNGIGIQRDDMADIFELGYTNWSGKNNLGHGIGLHVSRRIIKMHGGDLNIVNNSNDGATFYFRLPIVINDSKKEIIE